MNFARVETGQPPSVVATHQPCVVLVSHGFQVNYERGFCNGLAVHGIAATLISSDRTDYAALDPRVNTVNLRGSQDESRTRSVKALNMLRYHAALLWYALTHRRRIFHTIGLIEPPMWFGVFHGLWFRFFCMRYVLTVHDLLPHDRHTRINRWLFGLAFKLPHHLVVHTPKMGERLTEMFGVDANRITVMEHGIEPLGESEAGSVREHSSDGRLRILFFGTVAHYKGVDLLLDALELIERPFQLEIVGRCRDGDLRSRLLSRIKSHPYTSRIHWRDAYIGEDEVPRVLARADILVLPYRHIDQSGVLFQAMRSGVPMVATRVGSFADYITADLGEVCPPEDVSALARAILRLADRLSDIDRERIQEMARRYEWPATVAALDSVYAP